VTGLISRELLVKPILVIGMIAVARRDHPLLSIQRRLSRSDLMQHPGEHRKRSIRKPETTAQASRSTRSSGEYD
jgi:hypothetical protein